MGLRLRAPLAPRQNLERWVTANMKAALRDADMMQIKKSVEDAMATAIAGALDRFPLANEIDSLRAGSGAEPLEEEGADGGGDGVAGPDLLERDQQLLKLFQQHQQAIVDATALPADQLKGELDAIGALPLSTRKSKLASEVQRELLVELSSESLPSTSCCID